MRTMLLATSSAKGEVRPLRRTSCLYPVKEAILTGANVYIHDGR